VGPFHQILRIFFLANKQQLFLATISTALINVNWFSWTPKRYWIWGFFWGLITPFAGYLVVAFAANWALVYCLHLYYYGRYFRAHSEYFQRPGELTDKSLANNLRQNTKILQELVDVCNFYEFLAASAFAQTYAPQVLLLFYLFVDMPIHFRAIFLL
jgi:hypothetical protein